MRRRDFLATLAAAVGCAAVPEKALTLADLDSSTGRIHIGCVKITKQSYQLLVHDGNDWVEMPKNAKWIHHTPDGFYFS